MPWCANPLCGRTFGLEEHHIQHRSQLGTDDPENLVLICRECHQRHHDLGLLVIERVAEGVRFTDRETGETAIHRCIPQEADGPSGITDAAALILNFFDLTSFSQAIKGEPDEVLSVLYDQVREIRKRAWQAQAAIIAELQERANYGDEATKGIAERLGISVRTAQYRGKIYREILGHPETADVGDILLEESWYREAVDTEEPRRWIQHAADRKAEDPTYSVRKFRADIAAETGETVSVTALVVVCREGNTADRKLAQKLEASLRVPVTVVLAKDRHRLLKDMVGPRDADADAGGDLADPPTGKDVVQHGAVAAVHAREAWF